MKSPLPTPDIQLKAISVAFGPVQALDNVSLPLVPGTRHAVIGENGAGKSTLMRVLFGLQTPDSGTILVNTTSVTFSNPADAIQAGIGMVQQHFELIPAFTVAENILLGAESEAVQGGRWNRTQAETLVYNLSVRSGLPVSPSLPVRDLSVAARQRVEILKALYRNARVLILDEPTAVLAPSEAQELWSAVRRLSETGTTVVFITHKLDEVLANADTITVLRRGRHILTVPASQTNAPALAAAMLGETEKSGNRTMDMGDSRQQASDGSKLPALTLRSVSVGSVVQDATLTVESGEIVGLAGVDGSGQSELIAAIFGLRPVDTGEIQLTGTDITQRTVAERRASGLGFVPDDRHQQAIIAELPCEENILLGQHRRTEFTTKWGGLRRAAMVDFLETRARAFDVRGAKIGLPIRALSGGNQQKLVLARELARSPRVLIAAQPTRGLDFSATAFVHETLLRERNRGTAILLQSLDLDEILHLSDRIAVMFAGRIVRVFDRSEATIEAIGAALTGAEGKKSSL